MTTMLRDDAFQRAPKMARLFEYLVDKALSEEDNKPLSGYEVGVEALGKPADFDPSTDAGVRVETARLRRILTAYNAEHPASGCVITLPKGTYRPYFDHTPEPVLKPKQPIPFEDEDKKKDGEADSDLGGDDDDDFR